MSKHINVYWAPDTGMHIRGEGEQNMLYPNPQNLFNHLVSNKNKDSGTATYLSCPVSSEKFKNIFVFYNAVDCLYNYDFTNEKKDFYPITENFIDYKILRPPTISDGPLVTLNLKYTFFSEEPLIANFMPPIFNKPQYTKYGTVCPGEFDIGQWYRPYPLEIQMWDNKGVMELKDGEPLFYVEFKTNKKINLIRYKMTPELSSLSSHCVTSTKIWGRGTSMSFRYNKFKQSNMDKIILKEIKGNIIK